jgi:hypothetical protein
VASSAPFRKRFVTHTVSSEKDVGKDQPPGEEREKLRVIVRGHNSWLRMSSFAIVTELKNEERVRDAG